ncbi:hypothetical protein D3C84_1138390 [compost metagenome]
MLLPLLKPKLTVLSATDRLPEKRQLLSQEHTVSLLIINDQYVERRMLRLRYFLFDNRPSFQSWQHTERYVQRHAGSFANNAVCRKLSSHELGQ